MRFQGLLLSKCFTFVLPICFLYLSVYADTNANTTSIEFAKSESFFSNLKLNFSFYQYRGDYSVDNFTTTHYQSTNYKLGLDYKYSDAVSMNLSTYYREKESQDRSTQNNSIIIGRTHEFGLLDPAFALNYKIKFDTKINQSVKLSLRYSPSFGPKRQKRGANDILVSEARGGYSFVDSGLAYDANMTRTQFGVNLGYRSPSIGYKLKSGIRSEFDPEKWISLGSYLSYDITEKISIGPSVYIYRPALLGDRDYRSKIIGMLTNEFSLNYQLNESYSLSLSSAQSKESYFYDNGQSEYVYAEQALAMGLSLSF